MALTKYLRTTVDARFVNVGAKITNAQYDETLRSFHDDIDALEASLVLSAGAVLHGVQEMDGDASWNGSSPSIHCSTDAGPIGVTLPTALCIPGMRVQIMDVNGAAAGANVTISGEGGEVINGAGTLLISTNWDSYTLEAVDDAGTPKWVILN